jgi:GNAT superfamily N-acetyltransferase
MCSADDIHYRLMDIDEAEAVYGLIARVFNDVIAPEYSPEGVQEFLKYLQPDLLVDRGEADHFILLAATGAQLIGMIEVRNYAHISLLFVDEDYQRRGISRELWRRALEICRQENSDLTEVSVNSSPGARPVYERLGFEATAPEQVRNGMRFIPMVFRV